MDSFDVRPLSGTLGGYSPFFSPDGNWIGFFQSGRIKKLLLSGGNPQTIVDASNGGAYWSDDNRIVFHDLLSAGLMMVSADGGTSRVITDRDVNFLPQEQYHFWPQMLPDGRSVIFTTLGVGQTMRAVLVDTETRERYTLLEDAVAARYVPAGYLVFARAGELLAAPFDVSRLELTGSAIPVAQGMLMETEFEYRAPHYAVSDSGTLVYVRGNDLDALRKLVTISDDGATETIPISNFSMGMRLAPDQDHIAFFTGSGDIDVAGLSRGDVRRLTDDTGGDFWPIWSPDGAFVYYASDAYGGSSVNVYRIRSDGSGIPERVTVSMYHQQPQSISPDGKKLAITQINDDGTDYDVMLVDLENGFAVEPILQTPSFESLPSFSPDGRWLAYASEESGRREVYIRAFPGPGVVIPVSIGGGTEPAWSGDGRTVFYRDIEGHRIYAVRFSEEPRPRFERPVLVLEGEFFRGLDFGRTYDVWADGKKFLVIDETGMHDLSNRMNIVLNWFSEVGDLMHAAH
jgi:serine/threonine-protein kinase